MRGKQAGEVMNSRTEDAMTESAWDGFAIARLRRTAVGGAMPITRPTGPERRVSFLCRRGGSGSGPRDDSADRAHARPAPDADSA